MQVKPIFGTPPQVKLSKSEVTSLSNAALTAGQLAGIRPDLELEGVARLLSNAMATLEAEAEVKAKPEGEK